MKIFLLLLVAGIFLAPSFMVDSHGLSCASPNVTQAFEESDVVFAGTVVSKEYSAPSDERTLIAESLFSIKEPFKGNLQDQITVTSNERFWGINFTLGEEYLVFADYFGAEVQTQLCGPTSPIEFSDVDIVRNISEYVVLSPLKQFKSGIAIEEIKCRDSLVTVLKYDGSPACVTYQTGEALVEHRWATCEDGIFHGRGHPCGPRSSPGIMKQESYKTVYPKFDGVTEIINPEHE